MDTISLLGRDVSDAAVAAFFQDHLGHVPDWEDLDLDADNYYSEEIDIPNLGLEVSVFNENRFRAEDPDTWYNSSGIIGALYFSSDSAATFTPPLSVTWQDTLPDMQQKLQQQGLDCCVFDNLLAVKKPDCYTTYVFKQQVLDEVRIELKPVLLPPVSDFHVPELAQLQAALGLPLEQMQDHPAWADIFELCEEDDDDRVSDGAIDLSDMCGLRISLEDEIIVGYKFYNDREQDAVRWEGELPANLKWSDCPLCPKDMKIVKQRDDEFDGYMLGTYFKHDIHLYYNKLHGTFARITYGIEDFLC